MRLPRVENGFPLPQRMLFKLITFMQKGTPPYDVVRMLFFKPQWFGKKFGAVTQKAMREPSDWEVWQRELFAAHVSQINQCPF